MTYKSYRLIAVALMAGALAGCQTASVDTMSTASYQVNAQGERASRKVAFAKKQFAAGHYGLAEKHFRLAVESTPENGQAWLGLAAAYDQLGRFDLSDRAYDRLRKLEGRKASILNNQGYSYILRGDMAKARQILADAKALAPGNVVIEGNWNLAVAG